MNTERTGVGSSLLKGNIVIKRLNLLHKKIKFPREGTSVSLKGFVHGFSILPVTRAVSAADDDCQLRGAICH